MSYGDDGRFARRQLLGVIGAGMTVGIAGCIGDGNGADTGDGANDESAGDGTGNGGGNDDSADADDHRYAGPFFDHPGDEPAEFTSDQACPVCNMTPSDYQNWQCQLAHDNGDGVAFDTPGCLFAYYAAPPIDDEIVGAWVTDFESGDLIDATEASFVLISDVNAAEDDPMRINPRAFEDRDDAVAYLEEWDAEDLTEDDIVELSDVDRDIAAIYRGNRLP